MLLAVTLSLRPLFGQMTIRLPGEKDITFQVLGPVGDVVSEWVIMGAFIKTANFDDYDWSTYTEAVNLTMTIGMDYCILNY